MIFTLFSCERERILPFSAVDPLLVFHSIATVDEPLSVSLEKTSNLTDPEAGHAYVTSADFSIQHNEQIFEFKGMNSQSPGVFIFEDIIPQIGDFIKVEVNVEGLEICSTEIFIIDNTRSEVTALNYDETSNIPMVKTTVDLDVSESEPSYFIIYVEGMIQNEQTGEIENKRFNLTSNSDLIDNRISRDRSENTPLIFVANTTGSKNKLEMDIEGIPSSFQPNSPKESLHLIVENLSPDLYEYYLSLELANSFDRDRTFQEPFIIHTNIDGGIGIFGTSHITKHQLNW